MRGVGRGILEKMRFPRMECCERYIERLSSITPIHANDSFNEHCYSCLPTNSYWLFRCSR